VSDEAWRSWRAEGWGASDIAAAWTGRYGGAYKVVARKAGLLDEEDLESDRVQRGHDLEPALAAMVQIATGWYVVGEQTWCESPDEPRHRCTVDGFVSARLEAPLTEAEGPVEFKTHGVEVRPAWDYYDAQVQWQLHVTEFERAVLAVATVDDMTGRIVGFRLSVVEADPLAQASLVALADLLTEHLEAGTLPAPDGSDLATEAVRAVTWTSSPEDLAVDLGDLEEQVARYGDVKAALAVAKREQAELENILRDRIGMGARGVAGPWIVTYSKPRRVLNEERVLEDYPQLGKTVLDREAADEKLGKALDEYREPLGARSLTVRRAKETT
jgi:predicted phage-related endonuclease